MPSLIDSILLRNKGNNHYGNDPPALNNIPSSRSRNDNNTIYSSGTTETNDDCDSKSTITTQSFYETWKSEIATLKSRLDKQVQTIVETSQHEMDLLSAAVTGQLQIQPSNEYEIKSNTDVMKVVPPIVYPYKSSSVHQSTRNQLDSHGLKVERTPQRTQSVYPNTYAATPGQTVLNVVSKQVSTVASALVGSPMKKNHNITAQQIDDQPASPRSLQILKNQQNRWIKQRRRLNQRLLSTPRSQRIQPPSPPLTLTAVAGKVSPSLRSTASNMSVSNRSERTEPKSNLTRHVTARRIRSCLIPSRSSNGSVTSGIGGGPSYIRTYNSTPNDEISAIGSKASSEFSHNSFSRTMSPNGHNNSTPINYPAPIDEEEDGTMTTEDDDDNFSYIEQQQILHNHVQLQTKITEQHNNLHKFQGNHEQQISIDESQTQPIKHKQIHGVVVYGHDIGETSTDSHSKTSFSSYHSSTNFNQPETDSNKQIDLVTDRRHEIERDKSILQGGHKFHSQSFPENDSEEELDYFEYADENEHQFIESPNKSELDEERNNDHFHDEKWEVKNVQNYDRNYQQHNALDIFEQSQDSSSSTTSEEASYYSAPSPTRQKSQSDIYSTVSSPESNSRYRARQYRYFDPVVERRNKSATPKTKKGINSPEFFSIHERIDELRFQNKEKVQGIYERIDELRLQNKEKVRGGDAPALKVPQSHESRKIKDRPRPDAPVDTDDEQLSKENTISESRRENVKALTEKIHDSYEKNNGQDNNDETQKATGLSTGSGLNVVTREYKSAPKSNVKLVTQSIEEKYNITKSNVKLVAKSFEENSINNDSKKSNTGYSKDYVTKPIIVIDLSNEVEQDNSKLHIEERKNTDANLTAIEKTHKNNGKNRPNHALNPNDAYESSRTQVDPSSVPFVSPYDISPDDESISAHQSSMKSFEMEEDDVKRTKSGVSNHSRNTSQLNSKIEYTASKQAVADQTIQTESERNIGTIDGILRECNPFDIESTIESIVQVSTFLSSTKEEKAIDNYQYSDHSDQIASHKGSKERISDHNGDLGTYTGSLSGNKANGIGTMVYDDGRIYTGAWQLGWWHGLGKSMFDNGDSYTGEYYKDQRHGIGRYEWHDGRVYDGRFECDQRHGQGTYSWPDGSVYTGDFKLGLRHGRGSYTFADGSAYTGEWADGKYHGKGECVWKDGRRYIGEWQKGRAHGYGVDTKADGTIRHDGLWHDNKPVRQKAKDSEIVDNENIQGPQHQSTSADGQPDDGSKINVKNTDLTQPRRGRSKSVSRSNEKRTSESKQESYAVKSKENSINPQSTLHKTTSDIAHITELQAGSSGRQDVAGHDDMGDRKFDGNELHKMQKKEEHRHSSPLTKTSYLVQTESNQHMNDNQITESRRDVRSAGENRSSKQSNHHQCRAPDEIHDSKDNRKKNSNPEEKQTACIKDREALKPQHNHEGKTERANSTKKVRQNSSRQKQRVDVEDNMKQASSLFQGRRQQEQLTSVSSNITLKNSKSYSMDHQKSPETQIQRGNAEYHEQSNGQHRERIQHTAPAEKDGTTKEIKSIDVVEQRRTSSRKKSVKQNSLDGVDSNVGFHNNSRNSRASVEPSKKSFHQDNMNTVLDDKRDDDYVIFLHGTRVDSATEQLWREFCATRKTEKSTAISETPIYIIDTKERIVPQNYDSTYLADPEVKQGKSRKGHSSSPITRPSNNVIPKSPPNRLSNRITSENNDFLYNEERRQPPDMQMHNKYAPVVVGKVCTTSTFDERNISPLLGRTTSDKTVDDSGIVDEYSRNSRYNYVKKFTDTSRGAVLHRPTGKLERYHMKTALASPISASSANISDDGRDELIVIRD